MSKEKPMKKPVKIVLIVLLVLVLLGICFGSVALYAHNEIHKERFTVPEADPLPSATALPTEKGAVAGYITALYDKTVNADDVEASWHTDVNLSGEIETPFAEADRDVISYIRDQTAGQIAGLYPNVKDAIGDKSILDFSLLPSAFIDYTAQQGKTNDAGETTEEDFYFIDAQLDPARLNTADVMKSDIYAAVTEKLAPAMTVTACEAEPVSATISYKIDRVQDHLLNVDYTRAYRIRATVTLNGEYKALLPEGDTAEITLPYEVTERISFLHYGARFTERVMVVNPDDMKALPADVKVDAAATKDDYTLTFDVSDPEALRVDPDGVMTVSHKAKEEPVTVTMTLEYDGHTYTDTMTIYITELEVATDGK